MNMVEQVTDYVKNYDEEVGKAIELELGRQRRNLELIASENIISPAVMMAMATVPANKYAEGYPGKRYYGGCENVDIVENLAIERLKNYLAVIMHVFSHTQEQMQTMQYIRH